MTLFLLLTATAMSPIGRLPHQAPLTFLQRAAAPTRTLTPSRFSPPRISAYRIGQRFYSSIPARRLAPTLPRYDKYTPERRPNADWPYLYHQYSKMANLDPYFQQVDSLQDKFIERLREAVAIPSISSEDQRRPDVVKVGPAHTGAAEGTQLITR